MKTGLTVTLFMLCTLIPFDNITSFSSNPKKHTVPPKWYKMITGIPNDYLSFYHEDFTVKEIPLYLGLATATTIFLLTDNQTWKASNRFYNSSSFNKTLSNIFTGYGDGKTQLGLAAAFSLFGLITNNNKAFWTASEIVESFLTSGIIVQVLKHIAGRQRPDVSTRAGGRWKPFPNQIKYFNDVPEYDAFPSGHLTTSLATLIVIAENYPKVKWILPAGCAAELLLAASMVSKGIHWYSDYPLAAFLGYEFGKIAVHNNNLKRKNESDKAAEFYIEPYFNAFGSGIEFSFNF